MTMRWMSGVVITCGLLLLASVATADKATVEKRSREASVTSSLKDVPTDKALDMICTVGGVTLKNRDLPKDAPTVTAELKNVSVLEAVELITKVAGLTYAIVDDGIEVRGKKKD